MEGKNIIKILSVCLVLFMTVGTASAELTRGGYESKYHDYNPTKNLDYADVTGMVYIAIRAGGSAMDLDVFIIRSGMEKEYPFDGRYREDKGEDFPGQNPGYLRVSVGSSGITDIRLTPGNYTAYLRNGNAGQMEQQSFYVGAKGVTFVNFLGHAVSSSGSRKKDLDIISGIWGFPETCRRIFVPEVNHTVHHDGVNETVIDVAEHTEYRYWISDAVGHTEYQYRDWVVDVPGTGAWTEVHDYEFEGSHYVVDVPGVPEQGHWELHHAAVAAWLEMFGDYNDAKEFVGMGNGNYTRSGAGVNDPYVFTYIAPAHHDAVTNTIYHAEVNHTEYRTVTQECYEVYDKKWFLFSGWKVKCTNHKDHGEGWHTESDECHKCITTYGDWQLTNPCAPKHNKDVSGFSIETCECDFETRIVVDKAAWSETVVVTEAWDEHFGDYNAEHEYVGDGNGDYTRSGTGVVDPFVYTYHEPTLHAEIPEWTETRPTEFEGSHYVVDVPGVPEQGHWELFHPATDTTYKWTDWSAWSDTPATASDTRQVNTRWVNDDMVNGHYSEWSDTPQGSCAMNSFTPTVNEPCQTRIVPATYKEIIISEPWDEIIVDVPAHWETLCDPGRSVTVTSVLQGLVKNGELHIAATDYERLFGRINGDNKYLKVEYVLNGIQSIKTVSEDEDLNIP